MDTTAYALPLGMVRGYWEFWPWSLLCRRWPLWIHQPPVGQEGLRTENWIVRNVKLDHPGSPKTITALGRQHEREALKDISSADQLGSNQGWTGSRSMSSTNGKAKPDAEKSPEEVAVE
jgi:hypothetical protein